MSYGITNTILHQALVSSNCYLFQSKPLASTDYFIYMMLGDCDSLLYEQIKCLKCPQSIIPFSKCNSVACDEMVTTKDSINPHNQDGSSNNIRNTSEAFIKLILKPIENDSALNLDVNYIKFKGFLRKMLASDITNINFNSNELEEFTNSNFKDMALTSGSDIFLVNCEQISECETCLSSEQCISCFETVVSSSKCLINCPNGMYNNYGACENCLTNCAKCLANNICLECVLGYDLNNENSCEPLVISQRSLIETNSLKCPDNCAVCSTPFICTTCFSNAELTPNSTCELKCSDGQYLDKDLNICKNCNSSCNECFDSINCKTCAENFTFRDNKCMGCQWGYHYQNNQCILEALCPAGLYQNFEKLGVCFPCNDHCLLCKNTFICSTCEENYSLIGFDELTNTYIEVISDYYFNFKPKSENSFHNQSYHIVTAKCILIEEASLLLPVMIFAPKIFMLMVSSFIIY